MKGTMELRLILQEKNALTTAHDKKVRTRNGIQEE